MVTPATVYDYHPRGRRLETLKVQEIPSGYDAAHYATERLMVPARDGTQDPGLDRLSARASPRTAAGSSSSTPMAPTACDPAELLDQPAVSLLDRGYAYAIAHIRGGDDLGYGWYLDGKLEKRTGTRSTISSMSRRA